MREESKEPCCAEFMDRMTSGGSSVEACPMFKMCGGAMRRANPGLFLAIAGIALLVLGGLIFLKPMILGWFMAGMSILLGIGMLVVAVLLSRFATRSRAA